MVYDPFLGKYPFLVGMLLRRLACRVQNLTTPYSASRVLTHPLSISAEEPLIGTFYRCPNGHVCVITGVRTLFTANPLYGLNLRMIRSVEAPRKGLVVQNAMQQHHRFKFFPKDIENIGEAGMTASFAWDRALSGLELF